MIQRIATSQRETNETRISATINLDGSGRLDVETGIGFFDHMLTALAFHAGLDLSLQCSGDLGVDDHHTVEDCALVLGKTIDDALGERKGLVRFGSAYAPLDEALARSVIDLSGRPFCIADLGLRRDCLGELSCENVPHFFKSLAIGMRATIHIDLIRGENDHHRCEAAFKACALALRAAVSLGDNAAIVPSTKGVLSS